MKKSYEQVKKEFSKIKGTKQNIIDAIEIYGLMSKKYYKNEIKVLKELLKQYS